MKVDIVKATTDHIQDIASAIRESDRAELWAGAGVSPEDALRLSLVASSAAWTAIAGGSVVCMFGVSPSPVLQGVGVPWMIGTSNLDRHSRGLLRDSRPFLRDMFENYLTLANYVDDRNTRSIRWLRWLGFTIEAPQPTGPFGLPFHRFHMTKKAFHIMTERGNSR